MQKRQMLDWHQNEGNYEEIDTDVNFPISTSI